MAELLFTEGRYRQRDGDNLKAREGGEGQIKRGREGEHRTIRCIGVLMAAYVALESSPLAPPPACSWVLYIGRYLSPMQQKRIAVSARLKGDGPVRRIGGGVFVC